MNFTVKRHFSALVIALAAAAMAGTAGLAGAQTTSATEASAEPDTLSPLQEASMGIGGAADAAATQTVVLLGEKVSVENPDSAKGPFVDIAALTTATLGGKVVDLTTHGLTIAKTAKTLPAAISAKPDIAVIFTGFSDEKAAAAGDESAGTDEDQRKILASMVSRLQKGGAKVFLVPASTTVGALGSANLRLVATDYNATFVPMGTEVSGRAYEDAFAGISAELSGKPVDESPAPTPVPATFTSVRQEPKTVETPAAAPSATDVNLRESKANLQEELQRIAGEAGDAAKAPPKLTLTTATDMMTSDTGTSNSAYPPGGSMTKRGAEAQENINMRPLPAVKAFRPSIPVPRNQVDKKEPGLSR